MGTRSTVLGLPRVTNVKCCQGLSDCFGDWIVPGNNPGVQTVPETDTGGLVEYTEALERTVLKELGKMPP